MGHLPLVNTAKLSSVIVSAWPGNQMSTKRSVSFPKYVRCTAEARRKGNFCPRLAVFR